MVSQQNSYFSITLARAEVGKLWPAGQMWPAERFLWPAARPRTQSTLLDFFR